MDVGAGVCRMRYVKGVRGEVARELTCVRVRKKDVKESKPESAFSFSSPFHAHFRFLRSESTRGSDGARQKYDCHAVLNANCHLVRKISLTPYSAIFPQPCVPHRSTSSLPWQFQRCRQ